MPNSGWIVVPAYNEAFGLEKFAQSLLKELDPFGSDNDIHFTILFVNDGSADNTQQIIENICTNFRTAVISCEFLCLLRNFGHQAALKAGLRKASADADFAITMDADGEHPPKFILAMVEKWKQGAKIVHTLRLPNDSLGRIKVASSRWYYIFLKSLSGIDIEPGMADFKLWDGELLRQVASFLPFCGSSRSFASWLMPGAPRLPYEQNIVAGRTSRFTMRKMLSLALGGIVRYSDAPLRLAGLVGIFALGFATVLTVFSVIAFINAKTIPGWTSIIIAIAIFGGLQSLAIGILGEYLLRNWFRHSLPSYVIKKSSSPIYIEKP